MVHIKWARGMRARSCGTAVPPNTKAHHFSGAGFCETLTVIRKLSSVVSNPGRLSDYGTRIAEYKTPSPIQTITVGSGFTPDQQRNSRFAVRGLGLRSPHRRSGITPCPEGQILNFRNSFLLSQSLSGPKLTIIRKTEFQKYYTMNSSPYQSVWADIRGFSSTDAGQQSK
jgi:hypothetical protein